MELKEPKDGVGWSHGNMENKMDVTAVVQIGGINLKQIGQVTQHQLILMCLRLSSRCVEDVTQLFNIEKINREAMQMSSLERTG
jgi:hypothetical protein